MSFTIGSLFDGSGGFPLAATMCGGTPKWSSEIEPYPIAVTKSRFPGIKHLGSVTDIKGGEVEPVDVITFGSPCQDLSVAGKRAGLKHTDNGDDETTRSGLFMEAVRIIKEMREATNGVYPRFALWENVPGAFSSNQGEDFRIVLEELVKVVEPTAVMPEVPKNGWPYADSYCGDGWSIAYRVLDAQFWGVPQRRRRIYLVADFRGECAGKVSFEREGLRGYFETGRTPWQTVTGDVEGGSGATDCERDSVVYSINHRGGNVEQIIEDQTGTLTAAMNSSGNNKRSVAYTLKIRSGCEGGGKGALIQEDMSATLATNNDQYLFQPVGIIDSIGGQAERGWEGDTAPCLKASHYKFAPVVAYPAVGVDVYNQTLTGDKAKTLNSAASDADHIPCTVYSVENHPADSRVNIDDSGKVQTLTSRMGTGGGNVPMVMEPQLASGGNVTGCLMASGYEKLGAQEMFSGDYTVIEKHPTVSYWDGGQTMATLTANNAGGNQRMPDKENFNCVIECHVAGAFCPETGGNDPSRSVAFQEELSPTLRAGATPAVVAVHNADDGRVAGKEETPVVLDRAFFNQGQNAKFDPAFYTDGTVPTLVARGPSAVAVRYIVRRLTPTECARLQGFPDTWGHPDEKTEFTDEEYQFWLNVRNTHATINDKTTKEYTKDQILKWYNSLHTDSSEYKMWGNGIALPNALYVMQGIAEVMSEEKAARRKWLNDLLK